MDLDGTVGGIHPEAAVLAIKKRAERGAASRGRGGDGRKLGLVIEGGGMRGVCSGGGLVALTHLGLTDVFDEIYATSSGVMNAAYFLSGQAATGIQIYFENLTSRRFINRLRLWKMLDVDYVFDHIVSRANPLDVERVMQSPTRLYVSVIDSVSGEGVVLPAQNSAAPLLHMLKAATAIPVFYNRTVDIGGRSYMDGAIRNSFPIEQAIANGCTDLLVLLTRPMSFRAHRPDWVKRLLFSMMCARGNQNLEKAYARYADRNSELRDLALGRAPVLAGVNIATVCTHERETVQLTTQNAAQLRHAAVRYGQSVLELFGNPDSDWDLNES